MAKKKGAQVSIRKRAPWKPEKGQYIRPYGTRLAIPEPVGAVIVGAIVAAIIILAFYYRIF